MFELMVIACLLREPARCQEVWLPTEAPSLIGCMVSGQFEMVRWNEANPEWQARRWRCGLPRA